MGGCVGVTSAHFAVFVVFCALVAMNGESTSSRSRPRCAWRRGGCCRRNVGYMAELEEARLPHKLEELADCPAEDIVRALRRDHRCCLQLGLPPFPGSIARRLHPYNQMENKARHFAFVVWSGRLL